MSKQIKLLALPLCLALGASFLGAEETWGGWYHTQMDKVNDRLQKKPAKVQGALFTTPQHFLQLHEQLKVGLPVANKVLEGTKVGENLPSNERFLSNIVWDFTKGTYDRWAPSCVQKLVSGTGEYITSSRLNNKVTQVGMDFGSEAISAAFVQYLAIKASGRSAHKMYLLERNALELGAVKGLEYISGQEMGAAQGMARLIAGHCVDAVTKNEIASEIASHEEDLRVDRSNSE